MARRDSQRLRGLDLPRLSGGASPRAFGGGRSIESFGGGRSVESFGGGRSRQAFGGGRTIESFGGGAGPEAYGSGLRIPTGGPENYGARQADELRQLAAVGERLFEATLKIQRQDAILSATSKVANARREWSEAYTDIEAGAPADGKDFAKNTVETYDKWVAGKLEGLDGLERRIVEQELTEYGNSVYNQAVTLEAGVRKEYRKQQISSHIETARSNVYLRPQDYERELGTLMTAIEGSDLPAVARDTIADSARSSLSQSYWRAKVKADPFGAAAALGGSIVADAEGPDVLAGDAGDDRVLSQEETTLQDLSLDDRLALINDAEGDMRAARAERERAEAEEREDMRWQFTLAGQARAERSEARSAARAAAAEMRSARAEQRAIASDARAEARAAHQEEVEQLRVQRTQTEAALTAGILAGHVTMTEIRAAADARLIDADQARTATNFLQAQTKPVKREPDDAYAMQLMLRATDGDAEVINESQAAVAAGTLSVEQGRQIINDVQEFQRGGGVFAREDVKLGESSLKSLLEQDGGLGFDAGNKAEKAFSALQMYRRYMKEDPNRDPLEVAGAVADVWKMGGGKAPRPRYLVQPQGAPKPDFGASAQATMEALQRGEISELEASVEADAIEMMARDIDRKAGTL